MNVGTSGAENRPHGVFRSVCGASAALLGSFNTRFELFLTELEEERERLKRTLVLTLLLFFGLGLGFILLNIFVVALLWQNGWVWTIGVLSGVYLAIGIIAAFALRRRILTRPALFPATLNELGKDYERLRTASRG